MQNFHRAMYLCGDSHMTCVCEHVIHQYSKWYICMLVIVGIINKKLRNAHILKLDFKTKLCFPFCVYYLLNNKSIEIYIFMTNTVKC